MRLQLTVKRHALPPTNVLWTVPAQNLTSASTYGAATISQLLEDVNDIVQLESDGWGLEDYVVEVGGYECLHFQPIDSVLKEDDKVTIRALQTSDLRLRRIGGRHQITADGRHLFDGVAFGRPYLRKVSRPHFPIPPRKKRKLDIGHGKYIEDESAAQEFIVGSDSVVHNGVDAHGNAPEFNQSHDRPSEIFAGQPLHEIDYDIADEGDDDDSDSDFRSFDEEEGDEADMELSEELKALLEDDLSEPGDEEAEEKNSVTEVQQDMDGLISMRQLKKRKRGAEDGSEHASVDLNGDSNSPILLDVTVPPKHGNLNAPGINDSSSQAGEAVDLAERWRTSQDDFNGFDENAPSSEINFPWPTSSDSDSERSSSDSSLASTSESSSTGSESELGSESSSLSESGSESNLASDSSSDSSSENGSEAITVSTAEEQKREGRAAKLQSTLSALSTPFQNAPGQGSNATKKNNQRQRKRRRLAFLKAAGLLAPDAGFKELDAFELDESEAPVTKQSVPISSLESTFETREQRLLETLTPPKADPNAGLDPSEDTFGYVPEGPSNGLASGCNVASAPPPAALDVECQTAKPSTRARLDLDSSRRMLFGSLGLRTPKTPADEQLLREKLAKQGRTPKNGRAKHTTTGIDDVSGITVGDVDENAIAEGWKDKILLSAVECEVEGQLLKTPPFPFIQGWQQGNQKEQPGCQRGREDACSPKGQRNIISTSANEPGINGLHLEADPMVDGAKLNGATQSQLIREAEELSKSEGNNSFDIQDVPSMKEFNNLAALKVEDAVAGAVIAFRHLDMSKQTNWQPELSPYRTATIQEVLSDGMLKILLTEGDRCPMQALFDEYTGERVFDKFEMPIDEEDWRPDNGLRDMSYSDLIEPKLVEGKPLSTSFGQSTQTACSSTRESKSDEEISQVKDSAQLTDPSVQQPSAQVEVSTPRQREISRLIKEAGFDSSLDSDLLQPAGESAGTDGHGEDSHQASPSEAEKSHQASNSRSMNLDGVFSEADGSDLKSPLFRGSDSSSMHQNDEFQDSSGNFEQKPQICGIQNTQMGSSWRFQDSVVYPRISPLVIHGSRAPTIDGNLGSKIAPSTSGSKEGSKEGKLDEGSDMSDKGDESMFEGEESLFDSLKSTIPPSYVAPVEDCAPSPAGSQITNPCLSELEGKTSSEDDLPSLSEITSTARSSRISPPKLKTSTSPPIASSLGDRTSSAAGFGAETQGSSRFQSSQIPPGSQFVDLTLSSDPISPAHSDGQYGATQRSSVRIKQSSSQIKARERLSTGGKAGNKWSVRGRFRRPTT
jgi:hypothetical protein